MTADEIRKWVTYNSWANRRLLEASRLVSAEDFTKDLQSSHRSLRGTLLHIILGERKWYRFWRGLSYDEVFPEEQYPDVAAIAHHWEEIEADELEFASELKDERLLTKTAIREREYTLAEMFQHILNHSTYHRGQVVTLLRQLGHDAPATDFRVFLDQAR